MSAVNRPVRAVDLINADRLGLDRSPNAGGQQIASRAVHLHRRGNHILGGGIAAILNRDRSIAIDCVDVDAVGCSGVQESIGGRYCQRLRGHPIVVRRAGKNRKSPSAADAESGDECIVSVADIKIVAGVGAAATVGLRNKKIAPGQAEKQQTAQSLYSAHAISLTCNQFLFGEHSKHQTIQRRCPLVARRGRQGTRKSSIILSRCARYSRGVLCAMLLSVTAAIASR